MLSRVIKWPALALIQCNRIFAVFEKKIRWKDEENVRHEISYILLFLVQSHFNGMCVF